MGCNICNAGNYGARWTTEMKLGTKKVSNAAIEFNMTVEEVLEHLNTHECKTETVDVIELLNDPDFIKREVILMHIRLKDWLQFMMEAEEFGVHNMDRGIKLLKETRETLKLLAELEGKFNRGNQVQNQYIQVQGNMKMITDAIAEHCCPDCKTLLFGKLRDQKKLLEGSK